MAHSTHTQAVMAELGGKHLHGHKLVYDTPAGIRSSDQRATSSAPPKSAQHGEGRGSGQTTSEEASNEDDDEDSNSVQEDDQEDEEDDPEVLAPSHGRGKGKGKGPAIRVQPAGDDESQEEADDESASHETGLNPTKHPVNQLLMSNKKRTFSNVSNTSVLFGDDESEHQSFPRRKIARKLSNSSFKPLLKYSENANEDMNGSENAIETDDEDYSGVNLVPDDDDSDMGDLEEQEESFIIREEEQQATVLINQYNDARRLSLDSHASDNIFDMTAPLDETYGMDLPDLGFGQFFEPEALPSSPDPSPQRKYFDSSTKRVRFDDEVQVSDSSSTSSSELDSSLYPDLFMDQDKLPPSLSQLLENDNDEDHGDWDSPTSEMSFWDFGQDETQGTPLNGADDFDESSDPGSSGYETDMGDTTDEYDSELESDACPQTPLQKRSVLQRPSSAPASRFSSPKPFERSARPIGRIIAPTRGIFIHDDKSKAIAVTNRTTRKLTFYRPRASVVSWVSSHGPRSSSSSTANNSPRTSLQHFNPSDSEVSNEMFNNPWTADIMLTGIFGSAPTNDFFFGADSVGPPEAFYPFISIGANGTIVDDGDDYEDEDYEENDLNIADFMNLDDDVDGTDVEQEDDETDVPTTPATSMIAMNGSIPAQPTPLAETPTNRRRNASDAMLEHFDRGVVTAFRNNQNRYRDIACLPSDPTIRASVSRPIRSGKSAETVMTPLRKRSVSKRAAQSPYQASSPLVNNGSPLRGVAKASSRLHDTLMNSRRVPRMGTFS